MLIIHSGSHVEPLQYYKDLVVKTRVNGEHSLSFVLIGNDDSYNLVETDNIIEYNGQRYRIYKTKELSKGENKVKSIKCLHILFDLIDNDVTELLNGLQTINQVMSFILSGTAYTFDVVDNFASVELEDFGDDNSIALFQQALNFYGAEFEVNNTHITLKAQIGNITDFQFRYKHNIKVIEKNVEKVGSSVKLSIKLKFAELKKSGYPYEIANCGDTVFTIYEPMNISVTNRIVEYTEYPLEPKESAVIIANFQDDISDVMADFGTTQKQVNNLFDGKKKLPYNALDDATQRATMALNNALTELEFPENLGIIARDPNDSNRFVVLKSNGIGITTDGGLTFKDAITADGFVLTAGAIGQLKANNINVGENLLLTDNLLSVIDESSVSRLKLGVYDTDKYGLQLMNKAGDMTILDEDGIIQTDTIQMADNVDASNSLKLKFYIDETTLRLDKVKLNFSLEPFRAYSTGASSGGGGSETSSSGGGVTTQSTDPVYVFLTGTSGDNTYSENLGSPSLSINSAGSHDHGGAAGSHNHGNTSNSNYAPPINSDGSHGHSGSVSMGSHNHALYMHGHTVTVNIPNHSHSVNIPNHTHSIIYGIYTSTTATGVTIKVNGEIVDNTGYSTDQTSIDLTKYLTKYTKIGQDYLDTMFPYGTTPSFPDTMEYSDAEGYTGAIPKISTPYIVEVIYDSYGNPTHEVYRQDYEGEVTKDKVFTGWHTVELTSTQLGRINASLFIKSFIGV